MRISAVRKRSTKFVAEPNNEGNASHLVMRDLFTLPTWI